MATFRGENNKKAFETQPSELIKKNEATGEVMFAVDRIVLGAGGTNPAGAIANGDIVLLSKLPAFAKVLRVQARSIGTAIGAADIDIGHSSSAELNDPDGTVTAVTNAFIDAWDPDAADFDNMAPGDLGYLKEMPKEVFVTAEFVAAPAGQATTQIIEVIVEYVCK